MVYKIIVWTLVVFGISLRPLAAHPLGNFTVNHLTKLGFQGNEVKVHYVLDMAEIPTYRALREAGLTRHSQLRAFTHWAQAQSHALLPLLHFSVGEAPIALTSDAASAHIRPGAGGLPILYLTFDAHGTFARVAGTHEARYHDGSFPNRIGWHDIVVAPASEPTRELTTYPNALLGSPRATSDIALTLTPGGITRVRDVSNQTLQSNAPSSSAFRSNQLSDMLARGTNDRWFVLATFLVAVMLGALHALEPGHGKTLLAITLVGARATVKQAAILAASLTVAHTIGVLAFGIAINLLKGSFVPESIYPWITLISGSVIAVIGARTMQRRLQASRPHSHLAAHSHTASADHMHDVPMHDLDHAKLHAISGTAPLRFGTTVWAAMSGGIAPCPAALVVLLAAIALDQVAYGIFVIVAFSFGLAGTLTGIGIVVVRGASWLQRQDGFNRFVVYGPLASALIISAIGAITVGQGFAQRGVGIPPLVVTAITALAIAAYAYSPSSPHIHRETT